MRLNSVGLRTAPCGDPFSCSWNSAYVSSIFVLIFLSVRKSLIHFKVRPLIPYSVSLSITPDLQMRSKAFSRSRNTAKTFCLRSRAVLITLTNLTS